MHDYIAITCRYFLICKPHMYHRIYTVRNCVVCCVVIWIFSHILHLPNHVGNGAKRIHTAQNLVLFG